MVVTDLTVNTVPTKYATDGVDITAGWAEIDSTDGAAFTLSGDEIVLLRNDNVGAAVVTVNSAADPFGRTGDQTINMATGEYYVTGSPFPVVGWRDGNNQLTIDSDVTDVFACVIKIRR